MSQHAFLLVNADDLGLHKDIDHGILDCIEHGSVQSVSFSPNGRSVDWNRLLELVRHGVHVGLHVTLVGEHWASDGRLVHSWKDLAKQLLVAGRALKDAVVVEIGRQFELCAENGLDPSTLSHIDSHQHVHVLTGIWQPCLRLANAYGISRIRIPWCPSLHLIKKNIGGVALQTISHFRGAAVSRFLPCLGLAHAGHNTAAIVSDELSSAAHAGRRDIELVVHPGVNTPNLKSRYAGWQFDWSRERDMLLSAQFAEAVTTNGYTLSSPARRVRR